MSGAYAFGVVLAGFGDLPEPAQARVVVAAVELLVQANEELARVRALPSLYESGVRYREQRPGLETWRDAVETLAERAGNCKELSAWRCAELRARGEAATCAVIPWRRDGAREFHVVVRRGAGGAVTEDPSALLGMK